MVSHTLEVLGNDEYIHHFVSDPFPPSSTIGRRKRPWKEAIIIKRQTDQQYVTNRQKKDDSLYCHSRVY